MRETDINTAQATSDATLSLGHFTVELSGGAVSIWRDELHGRPLWTCPADLPLVRASRGEASVSESRGFFQVSDQRAPYTEGGPVDRAERVEDTLLLSGLMGAEGRWTLALSEIDDAQLGFSLSCDDDNVLKKMTIVWFWNFSLYVSLRFTTFWKFSLSLSLSLSFSFSCDDLFKRMTSSNEMCILYGFGKSHSMQVYNGLQLFGNSLLSFSIFVSLLCDDDDDVLKRMTSRNEMCVL